MIKKLLPILVMFLLFINIAYAYQPPFIYNKNQIESYDINRTKEIISSIPEEYFDGINSIKILNRTSYSDIDGIITCENYLCNIVIYGITGLLDDEIYDIILHEIGHKMEYFVLLKKLSDRGIFKKTNGKLSELYAENWRKQHGGDKYLCYSSDREIC